MQQPPPDWEFMGRMDGRYRRPNTGSGSLCFTFPDRKARDLYDAGYAKGLQETQKGPPRPSKLPDHTPIS